MAPNDAGRAASAMGMGAAGLTAGYGPIPGIYDEMTDDGGATRAHWQAFLDALGGMQATELYDCWDTAQRLIRENGTTYNVYDDSENIARPWRMDPIPLLVDAAEWRHLEAALIQRARLLNAIVGDIYGPQQLLRDGKLPPALVFGNPAFLRPLHGVQMPGGTHLHFVAFDLARGQDHKWWVLSDRTQAPSGAGYALENRIVMARTLPAIYRDQQVQRLAGFFQALSDNLVALTRKDNPLIVLLTPGPRNETYFEHAYLARYLGFPLVEGADLTVRDNRVYLKTLNGLKQVDLIFRRVDGEFCDPLELRTDSLLGVAGLVAAARAGNVVVANTPGSGIVESDALMSFLPGLCRTLFGEELAMPSLASWWCGQERERGYVLDNLDDLILRPTFSNRSIIANRAGAILPRSLPEDERAALIARMQRRPYAYFAQEDIRLSSAPSWRDDGLHPSPLVLRIYACADGDTYRIMPGGLSRTADNPDVQAVSMQQGDASKDTWVLSDTPVSTFSRLSSPDQDVMLRRSGSDLPSRVADNLFWLGRYAQRTEDTVRLMRSLILRLAGEAGAGDDPETLKRLLGILVDLGYLRPRTARRAAAGGIQAVERELAILLFDPQRTSGLLDLLSNLRRTASLVRERLSMDSWRILNGVHELATSHVARERLDMDDALALLNHILELLAGFSGMQMENMTRSIGWRLLDIGRRVERAAHMARLIRDMAVDGDPAAEGKLDLLLELGDSSMTYRTRYLSTVQLPAVVDLLLADDTNPRSVAFQVAVLADHVEALPRDREDAVLSREQYLVETMRSDLKLLDVQWLCREANRRGRRTALDQLLQRTEERVLQLSDALARSYFSHVLPTRSASAGGVMP